jgi:hypothetical protein
MIRFYGEEDHPLSAVRDCLFNIFAATLHIGGRSSISNLRTRYAVMTGTHLSRYLLIITVLNARNEESKDRIGSEDCPFYARSGVI